MINTAKKHRRLILINFLIIFAQLSSESVAYSGSLAPEIMVIPFPRQVITSNTNFIFNNELTIVLDKNHSAADQFTAEELKRDLKVEWNINAVISLKKGVSSIVLTRQKGPGSLDRQGYHLITRTSELVISANDEDGLFYGTQTLLQIIQNNGAGYQVPGLEITDWPDIPKRAVHYDTKHHQDRSSYVKSFIKDLSRYKVNILVWEWEDKFAYPSHPEIGAPGAFTMEEMQEFTRYAKQYHIQIVPLVQGLGHVSFILKWPQYKPLREKEASNWQFCPLKQGSYDLLFDLWQDAVEATPGSEYVHIGSDETYELGACDNCIIKSKEIGKSGLYHLFINKAAGFLKTKSRKVMVWERPMGWKLGNSPAKGIEPTKGLALAESSNYETPDFKYSREAKESGYEVFAYDPNPGVVPLMVPYMFEKGEKGELMPGSLEKSYRFLTSATSSGACGGMICTSWDDDDLHNQMWMMHFVNAAAWSWNSKNPDLSEFRESFFSSYYGNRASDMDLLFYLLNQGAYYFAGTLERNVWHYGAIGQTHLPDLPRGDAIEYDPYWNIQYKEKVSQSKNILIKMDSALQIIEKNKIAGVRNAYDFEIFRTSAELIKHTCLTYLDLSNLELAIRNAHVNRFVDLNVSLTSLLKAQQIIESSLKRRDDVFKDLVMTYEVTRLPKGLNTPDKSFFWQQDRARHFGFRRPDMSFLIYDEQLLDMEGYLEKLKDYIKYFKGLQL